MINISFSVVIRGGCKIKKPFTYGPDQLPEFGAVVHVVDKSIAINYQHE